MANTYGRLPGPVQSPVPLPRLELPGGLTLTKISGGSVRVNDAATGDSVSSITVGGTEILSGTVAWATDDLTFTRLLVRNINAYSGTSGYWATHDGVDKVLIWPLNGATSDTGAVVTTGSGFTPADTNMNSYQAFVAAVDWNSGNEGADAFADTGMYRVGFSMAHLKSLATTAAQGAWTLTGAEAWELDITTEDQTLSAYIGSKGVHTLGSSAVKKTLGIWGCFKGHCSLFLQSGAAQNPTYVLRIA